MGCRLLQVHPREVQRPGTEGTARQALPTEGEKDPGFKRLVLRSLHRAREVCGQALHQLSQRDSKNVALRLLPLSNKCCVLPVGAVLQHVPSFNSCKSEYTHSVVSELLTLIVCASLILTQNVHPHQMYTKTNSSHQYNINFQSNSTNKAIIKAKCRHDIWPQFYIAPCLSPGLAPRLHQSTF